MDQILLRRAGILMNAVFRWTKPKAQDGSKQN